MHLAVGVVVRPRHTAVADPVAVATERSVCTCRRTNTKRPSYGVLPCTCDVSSGLRLPTSTLREARRRLRGRPRTRDRGRRSRLRFPFTALPSAVLDLLALERQLGQQLLELRRVAVRVHPGLHQLQAFDAPFEVAALLVQRAQLSDPRAAPRLRSESRATARRQSCRSCRQVRDRGCPACRRCRRAADARSASYPACSYARPTPSRARIEGLEHRHAADCDRRRRHRRQARRRSSRRTASQTARRRCASRSRSSARAPTAPRRTDRSRSRC